MFRRIIKWFKKTEPTHTLKWVWGYHKGENTSAASPRIRMAKTIFGNYEIYPPECDEDIFLVLMPNRPYKRVAEITDKEEDAKELCNVDYAERVNYIKSKEYYRKR